METLQLNRPTTNARTITRKPTDSELLAIFPEAAEIVLPLLTDFKHRRAQVEKTISAKLVAINSESTDESYRYFWRKWVAVTLGEELYDIDRHISRLTRLQRLTSGKPLAHGAISEDMIQVARDVPIEDILDLPLKRSGKDFLCACPFHDERTPSFRIYTEANRGWCFGCNEGGDGIALYMRMHDCNFKEAVLALAGGRP